MPRFQTSDELSLYYEDAGAGVPVLCLPGLTRNARDFDWVAPHLGDLRLIRLDARGRGLSDHAPDFASYNVPREAQDVVELLDHLKLEQVVILGTSRGGLIALALAAMQRARLAGVILNDLGPVIEADAIARIMVYVGRAPNATTLAEAARASKAVLGAQFPTLTDETWLQLAAAQYQEQDGGLALRYDARLRNALLAQAQAGPSPDLWPMFDGLREIPCGLIRGANSDLLSAATATQMCARNRDMIYGEVPDRGHAPLLDEPQSLSVIRQVLECL